MRGGGLESGLVFRRAPQFLRGEASMARFEIEANIKRFQRLLSEVGMDPAQRQVVARLLVEEKEKLAKLNRTERAE